MSKLKEVVKSEFAKNVITLSTGTAVSQFISIAVSPILTRIYTPDDFGISTIFLTITTIIAALSTGSYEYSIVLPAKERSATNLVALSIGLSIAVPSIFFMLMLIADSIIDESLSENFPFEFLYFSPLLALLIGLFQTFSFWQNRKRSYSIISIGRLSQSLSTTIFNISLGLFKLGSLGLILSSLLGQLISTFYISFKSLNKINFSETTTSKILDQAREYKNFPKYNLPQNILDNFRDTIISLAISISFSNALLGYYSFSLRILRIPLTLIGSSISQVLYQKISTAKNAQEEIWPIVRKVLIRTSLVSFPFLLILMIFSPWVFSFVFGKKWEQAGAITQILTPWMFVNFVSSPISQIPLIFNKQKTFFLISLGFNIVIPTLFIVCGNFQLDIYQTLVLISLTASVYLSGIIYWIVGICKRNI